MKCKEKLEEEVDFWLGYISEWESSHDDPIPERAQQLLCNALLKLDKYGTNKSQVQLIKSNNPTIH